MLTTVWVKLESFESTLREVLFEVDQSGNFDQALLSAVILSYKPIFDHHNSSDLTIVGQEDGLKSTGEQLQPFVVRSSKNVTFGKIRADEVAVFVTLTN